MSSEAKPALFSVDSCSDSHIHSVFESTRSTTGMWQEAGIEKKRGRVDACLWGENTDARLSHTHFTLLKVEHTSHTCTYRFRSKIDPYLVAILKAIQDLVLPSRFCKQDF